MYNVYQNGHIRYEPIPSSPYVINNDFVVIITHFLANVFGLVNCKVTFITSYHTILWTKQKQSSLRNDNWCCKIATTEHCFSFIILNKYDRKSEFERYCFRCLQSLTFCEPHLWYPANIPVTANRVSHCFSFPKRWAQVLILY